MIDTWGLVVTMADRSANRFVTLRKVIYESEAARDAVWDRVPHGEPQQVPGLNADAVLLIDRWCPDSLDHDRYVSAAWVEEWTGEPIDAIVLAGNIEADRQEDWFRAELRRRAEIRALVHN